MKSKEIENKFKKLTHDFQSGREFEKSIENIIDYVNYCYEEKEKYKKQLNEFNKDKQIDTLNKKIEKINSHSLFILSDKEYSLEKAFRAEHYKKCNNENCFQYEITGTEIGTCIKMICPRCKEIKDITDISSW